MLEYQFNHWLNKILEEEESKPTIIAYYFGIFEHENGFMLYLTGAEKYSATDDEWPCKQDFIPKNQYFSLELTNSNWREAQRLVGSLVQKFLLTESYQNSFLFTAQVIAIGFDDGDILRIK